MTQIFRFKDTPPCEVSDQKNILFTSPGWACWMYGIVTRWEEDEYEILLYDQLRDKFVKWDSRFPEFYMKVPDVPTS